MDLQSESCKFLGGMMEIKKHGWLLAGLISITTIDVTLAIGTKTDSSQVSPAATAQPTTQPEPIPASPTLAQTAKQIEDKIKKENRKKLIKRILTITGAILIGATLFYITKKLITAQNKNKPEGISKSQMNAILEWLSRQQKEPASNIPVPPNEQCQICLEDYVRANIVVPCPSVTQSNVQHKMCLECIRGHFFIHHNDGHYRHYSVDLNKTCPFCQQAISETQLLQNIVQNLSSKN